MIHGVRLEEGRAAWYRNRWVRTRALEGAGFLRPDFSVDLSVGVANTHIVCHAGRLDALVESSLPTELTPERASTAQPRSGPSAVQVRPASVLR